MTDAERLMQIALCIGRGGVLAPDLVVANLNRIADTPTAQAARVGFAVRACDELDSMMKDTRRRCGMAATNDWFHSEIDRLRVKLGHVRAALREPTAKGQP